MGAFLIGQCSVGCTLQSISLHQGLAITRPPRLRKRGWVRSADRRGPLTTSGLETVGPLNAVAACPLDLGGGYRPDMRLRRLWTIGRGAPPLPQRVDVPRLQNGHDFA